MIMLLTAAFSGCLTTTQEESPGEVRIDDWVPGEWWRYEIDGHLPAPWMRSDQIVLARELGHEISYSVGLNVTLVASSDPEGVLSDDPYTTYLALFGLPLATDWQIGRGITTGSLFERYNRDGAIIRGTAFIDWPLEDGKTWETRFMGRDLQITALRDDGGFILTAMGGEEMLLQYRFDVEHRWFSSFTIFDEEGNVQAQADLLDHGLEGFSDDVYRMEDDSHWIRCTGDAGPLPASPASCGTGSLSIDVQSGGRSDFFYHLAYRSTGPGVQTVTHGTPDGEVQAINTDECPCDENRYWKETIDVAGRYFWEVNDFFSGEERWLYFMVHYACQTIYRMEGSQLESVDHCGA